VCRLECLQKRLPEICWAVGTENALHLVVLQDCIYTLQRHDDCLSPLTENSNIRNAANLRHTPRLAQCIQFCLASAAKLQAQLIERYRRVLAIEEVGVAQAGSAKQQAALFPVQ